jgi:hypothetical protein
LSALTRRWAHVTAPQLRRWWAERGRTLLAFAIAAMVGAALWRLGNELPRLLWEMEGPGAFDLQLRHREVHRWFAGLSVYDEVERGDYPPASYVLLWPLLGWLDLTAARWLWALTTLAALGALAWIGVQATTPATRRQAVLAGLLPFSVYATSATIRVGQLGNHILPLLVGGILLLRHGRARWTEDLLAALLLVGALVKPTLVAPFFWIVCFLPGRIRPIALASVGYAAISLFAASFQQGELLSILQGWLGERPQVLRGHANVHKWLALAGLRSWAQPVSLAILALLAWWVFLHRRVNVWLLLGVCAIVAHFWMHHRLYDDVLILVPMITLLRMAGQGPEEDGSDVAAGVLFALTWLTVHAPASLLSMAPPVSTLMELVQTAVWLAVLALLMRRAAHDRRIAGLQPSNSGNSSNSGQSRLRTRSFSRGA